MEKGNEHYLVKGRVFETLEEASAFFEDYRKATGVFLSIEGTQRKVTHIYDFRKEKAS